MTRPLQVIRTVDSRQTGGPEELLLTLCPALRAGGDFDPAILLVRRPDPAAPPARDFATRARSLDIPITTLPELRWRYGWLRGLPGRLGADLLHMHGQRGNYFVWLMRRLFPGTWGRLPLVATVHGWVQDNALRRLVTRLELATLRECDWVITVSEQQRRALLARDHRPERVVVVRNGVRLPPAGAGVAGRAAARARWGLAPDAFVIAAIGRLSTEKRLDLYLDVCAALARELPDATFLVVGGGKQEQQLRAQATALGLDARVLFTGLTVEMASIYAATDLVMLTSDTEGTPLVVLEAMANGIPVVATAVGGVAELVVPGESGLLAPRRDHEALVAAALRLHADPDLRARLVEGGRCVAGQHSLEQTRAGVERVYRAALGGRHD